MKLTKEQVKKVAKLANLSISEKDEEIYGAQLSEILDYVDQLEKVDTSDVEPTFNVTGLTSVMREDETSESLSAENTLKNASNVREGFFVTKGVFENE